MKKSGRPLNDLVSKYDKLLTQAVKVTGINLNLPKLPMLTPKDLMNKQQEYRWTAASLLSRYEQQNKIPHSLESSAVIQLDQKNNSLTITSLVSLQKLQLPELVFLLDYNSKKWFSLQINLGSRIYSEKLELISFGASMSFSLATIEYQLSAVHELTKEEIKETQQYFNHNWITGKNPKYCELNSWIDGEFRRSYVVNGSKSTLEVRIEQSELFFQNLSSKKAA